MIEDFVICGLAQERVLDDDSAVLLILLIEGRILKFVEPIQLACLDPFGLAVLRLVSDSTTGVHDSVR